MSTTTTQPQKVSYIELLSACLDAARQSAVLIREKMESGKNASILNKTDGCFDPQTEADIGAQYIIHQGLVNTYPGLNIVGEEPLSSVDWYVEKYDLKKDQHLFKLSTALFASPDDNTIKTIGSTDVPQLVTNFSNLPSNLQSLNFDNLLIYIDPLDGTSEFTKGNKGHVTTLISLTYHGHALGGIVYYPFTDNYLFGGIGLGCFSGQYPTTGSNEPLAPALTLLPTAYNQTTILAKHPFFKVYCADHLTTNSTQIQQALLPTSAPTPLDTSAAALQLGKQQKALNERIVVTTSSHFSDAVADYFTRIGIHLNATDNQPSQVLRAGGAGHKGTWVLTGVADSYIYPRNGTKKWDIGVLDGLVYAHGGALTNIYGDFYTYRITDELENRFGCVVSLYQHDSYLVPRPPTANQ